MCVTYAVVVIPVGRWRISEKLRYALAHPKALRVVIEGADTFGLKQDVHETLSDETEIRSFCNEMSRLGDPQVALSYYGSRQSFFVTIVDDRGREVFIEFAGAYAVVQWLGWVYEMPNSEGAPERVLIQGYRRRQGLMR